MIWFHRIRYWIRALTLRLRFLFKKSATEGELDEGLRFHLEMEIRQNLSAGFELCHLAPRPGWNARNNDLDPLVQATVHIDRVEPRKQERAQLEVAVRGQFSVAFLLGGLAHTGQALQRI